jgi:hypothetical protein
MRQTRKRLAWTRGGQAWGRRLHFAKNTSPFLGLSTIERTRMWAASAMTTSDPPGQIIPDDLAQIIDASCIRITGAKGIVEGGPCSAATWVVEEAMGAKARPAQCRVGRRLHRS